MVNMLSFLVSSLLAGAFVSAQSTTTSSANPACTSATFNINSASDLTTLTSCTNVQGDVVVSDQIPTINFGGITTITGNLQVIRNQSSSGLAQVTSISAPSLQSISGVITLTQLTQLNTLSFPSLTSIGGLAYTTLPVLLNLGFGGPVTKASSVVITDTQLTTLAGLNLNRADTISITNNQFLTQVALNTLTAVDTSLTVSANAAGVAVSFPVLANCGNFTIQQVGNLSINALANVTGSLGIQANALSFIQANNLTKITGDLAISNNTQLTNITMPKLTSVAGLTVANNTKLLDINFPALTTVQAIALSGAFTTAEFPALTTVLGGVNVQTTATGFTCPIPKSIVRSTSYTCKGATTSSTTTGSGSGSGTGTGSSSGSTTASTTTAKSAGILSAGFSVVAGVFGMFACAL